MNILNEVTKNKKSRHIILKAKINLPIVICNVKKHDPDESFLR